MKRALEHARGLRAIDLTGCLGLKQLRLDAYDVPRLERFKAVNCASMTMCSIRRTLGTATALKSINVADCVTLRTLQVQSSSIETLNAAGCRALETLNVYAPKCETLLLNKCASLRGLTEEMNTVRTNASAVRVLVLDSCKNLTSSAFADVINMCSESLTELSAEGCFMIDYADVRAPNLERCALSGCTKLEVVRVSSAKCRVFHARACKSLTEIRFENGAYELDTFDVRNAASLKRIVGIRCPAPKTDVSGCRSVDFIECG